ncbi:TlpA disulfide reductase family protein [Nonomuraea wenchangensis]|uniref:TlpA disulfide reductase family protein n=1 Tax=Nonomuraea wenchangensis TaxID=568860 RepID=UPI00343EE883
MSDPTRMLGRMVGEFAATTTDGEPVARALLSGETVVAFFSPTCGPCKEKAPAFAELVRENALDRQQVLAVVAGDGGDEAAAMTRLLEPAARVVLDHDGEGSLAEAFRVSAFPTFCLVDAEGVVRVVDSDSARFLVPAEA